MLPVIDAVGANALFGNLFSRNLFGTIYGRFAAPIRHEEMVIAVCRRQRLHKSLWSGLNHSCLFPYPIVPVHHCHPLF